METDAQGVRKKSFYVEEEDIVIKPSAELIPDEYEHVDNDVLFHVFRNNASLEIEFSENLLQSVQKIGYSVDTEKNAHPLDTVEQFSADLSAVKNEAKNKSALILVFFGYSGEEDGTLSLLEEPSKTASYEIKKVWNIFASNNCPELKNKPKIFIFCTSPKPVIVVQTDSMVHRTLQSDEVYDFPAESDMLIVYKKNNNPWSSSINFFVDELCENIVQYSKQYDIIDLVSYLHKQKSVPLVVSTLTRKFYLSSNAEREHLLTIAKNRSLFEETLKKLQEDVQKLHDTQKKKKDKLFSFSFRKKSEEKPNIAKKSEKSVVKQSNTPVAAGPRYRSPRTSTSTAPERRSRHTSETDSATIKNKSKPIWRI